MVRPHPDNVGLLLDGHGPGADAVAVLPGAVPARPGRGRLLPRRDRLPHPLVSRAPTAAARLAGLVLAVPVSLVAGAWVSGRSWR